MNCAYPQWIANPPLLRVAVSLPRGNRRWCVRLQGAAHVVQRPAQLPRVDRGVVKRTRAAVSEETAHRLDTGHIRLLSTLDHRSDLEQLRTQRYRPGTQQYSPP